MQDCLGYSAWRCFQAIFVGLHCLSNAENTVCVDLYAHLRSRIFNFPQAFSNYSHVFFLDYLNYFKLRDPQRSIVPATEKNATSLELTGMITTFLITSIIMLQAYLINDDVDFEHK